MRRRQAVTLFTLYKPVAAEVATVEAGARSARGFHESRAIAFHNGKQHAREAMLQIIEDLSARYGVINLGAVGRPTSAAADPAVIDEVAERCDWALVGACD
jgi:hypothetical protein